MRKFIISATIVQLLIFLTIFIREQHVSLLSYINTSFFFGGILVFSGLLIYVVQSGVFDIFTMSMRKVFKRKSTLEDDEMRPPSEALALPFFPVLSVGTATILFMGAALFTYYL